MKTNQIVVVAALAVAGLVGVAGLSAAPAGAPSAPRASGATPSSPGHYRPSHPGGGYRPGGGSHGHGSHGYRSYGHGGSWNSSHWGWGVGVAVGVPWALGWYDPYWWGPAYYPSYAYGPAYGGYGYSCGPYDDCWREQVARSEPTPPTTELGPVAPGGDGGPTQRPLHLNYCESARAWFPHVRACPGGWRLVLPEYESAR